MSWPSPSYVSSNKLLPPVAMNVGSTDTVGGARSTDVLNLPVVRVRRKKGKWQVNFENWLTNDGKYFDPRSNGPSYIFLGLWIAGNVAQFGYTFNFYNSNPSFSNFRTMLGITLPLARGAASCIDLSAGIILLPVCRNLLSLLRNTPIQRYVPVDRNIDFHRFLGWSVVLWSFVHSVAHMFNLLNLSRYQVGLVKPETVAVTSGPGATGQILVVLLFLIVTASIYTVRRKFFEIFWFTHHLFIVFFAILLTHGTFCFIQTNNGSCAGAAFWKYWVFFGGLYLLERIVRELRGRLPTNISKVVMHPSRVCEVQIRKPSCKIRSGQYIFLCCPQVAGYEWHPFTLTSAPEEDFISVHIRVAGDWTTAFAKQVGCQWDDRGNPSKTLEAAVGNDARLVLPRVMVDGPYGAASEDVFNYEVSVCFGAGIGVTPFASMLKSIWYKVKNPTKVIPLRKVYFYWICRDKDAFEWFQDLLVALEEEDLGKFLEIELYITGSLKPNEVFNVILNDEEGIKDGLTGLKSATKFGRPNLDAIFKSLGERHPHTDCGVFFCGPKPLNAMLHACCNKYTQTDGTRFYYHKENF
ncbi:hypothetical protein SmJEL517_g03089 [Synchytrium microbalum]|uniref:FAD-binding FR-type domain-containing protein n=1 Tax=Synchytrium microbalum TaxID=1806994 RepID=A0A507BZK7_9FUNG|nr:uncharacterized protein SmJEL517_g03089 [Synchytrium microbalum]TPX34237.1 hypothetical protein SmJEL517_g03089 [Synchytrium microbalum]